MAPVFRTASAGVFRATSTGSVIAVAPAKSSQAPTATLKAAGQQPSVHARVMEKALAAAKAALREPYTAPCAYGLDKVESPVSRLAPLQQKPDKAVHKPPCSYGLDGQQRGLSEIPDTKKKTTYKAPCAYGLDK